MHSAAIPVLDLETDTAAFAARIGKSFREFGFALVQNHGIDAALIDDAWSLTSALFDLPDEAKRRYHAADLAGARGYTPLGTEIAKGGRLHDLKEFWHVGRELPAGCERNADMPPNIWPERPDGFQETFTQLFAQFDRVGAILLSRIAMHLGLASDWFDPAIADGNSVLRLLHYPPISGDHQGAMRAGPHEDINLITLLLGTREAGLELLGADGHWQAVDPPPGALVVNIGDMLQRLTNRMLPSTTHRVSNPPSADADRSRYAMPFFVHLRGDFRLETIDRCITPDQPDANPDVITASEYLEERLREIGLRRPPGAALY